MIKKFPQTGLAKMSSIKGPLDLDLKKVSSDNMKLGDLADQSKKAKYSNMVFQLEDDQLELDESDINELDQNMQVYLSQDYNKNSERDDQMPTSSLFGRLQQGMIKINQKYQKKNSGSSYNKKFGQALNCLNDPDFHSNLKKHKVSIINPSRRDKYRMNDEVREEDDSFQEDQNFSKENRDSERNQNSSLVFKDKNIFTNSFKNDQDKYINDNQVENNQIEYLREMGGMENALKLKTSNMILNRLAKAQGEFKLQKYDSQLNEQFIKQLEQRQDNLDNIHFILHGLLIIIIILNNLFSILVFLVEEYINDHTQEIVIDMVILFFYLIEFGYNYYQHPPPKSQFFSLYYTWIDVATMITPLITLAIDEDSLQHIKIVRILRVSKVIRILRLVKIIKSYTILQNQQLEEQKLYMQLQISPILQQVVLLISQLLIIEFLGAALVNIISETQDDSFSLSMTYLDALYYMIITSATVGYGDIYPKTIIARLIVVTILLCVFAVFGDNISKIGQLMRQANFNDKYYYMKNHIVIFGTHKAKEISKFIMQLIDLKTYHHLPEILIVGNKLLKETDLETLIKNELIENKVKYLSAINGIDHTTLRKANINNASSIFFLGHLNVLKSSNAYTQNLLHKIKQIDQYISVQSLKTKMYVFDPLRLKKTTNEPVKFYVQLCSAYELQNFFSQEYIKDFMERLYSLNIYKFKCELMSQALFSPGILPFIENFFVSNPQGINKENRTLSQKIQFKNFKYQLRVASFPLELLGMNFYDAVSLIYKSQQKTSEQNEQQKKPKRYLKMILIGVVHDDDQSHKPEKATSCKLSIESIINPGSEYQIRAKDKAYLMVRELGEYQNLIKEKLDQVFSQQISEIYHQKQQRNDPILNQLNEQQNTKLKQNEGENLNGVETEQNRVETERPLIAENMDFEAGPPKILIYQDTDKPLQLADIKIKNKNGDSFKDKIVEKTQSILFNNIIKSSEKEQTPKKLERKETEEEKRARVLWTLQNRFLSAITEKETETQLMQSFENYLRNLYTYKVSLKKYQYLLWDEDKIQGKISNHILIFGFNPGIIHFVKATREKCDLPIVIFFDEDISLDIFKMNNVYGNIFHFWGDPFDKNHLDQSSITKAYGVIILQDYRKEKQVLEDGPAISIFRNIEQFYQIERLIVEVADTDRLNMIGYEPKDDENSGPFYYWPFVMNGRIFPCKLFDSMIAWTQTKENHLDTIKKFISNDLLQKETRFKQAQQQFQKQEQEQNDNWNNLEQDFEEHSNVLSLQVPPLYAMRSKTYSDLMKDFMTMNCICIGIYRQIEETNHEKLLEEEFSFIKEEQMTKTYTIKNRDFLKDFDLDSQDGDFNLPRLELKRKVEEIAPDQNVEYNVITNLSDFKCNFSSLHTEQLILNPPANFQLKIDDKVLVIGQIPVKSCESFLLMHRMKRQNTNGLSIRQERRLLAIEALQSKLNRRDKNLSELQKELFHRTQKYTSFQNQNQDRIKSNMTLVPNVKNEKDSTIRSGVQNSIQSEIISSFSISNIQDEKNEILVHDTHQNQIL